MNILFYLHHKSSVIALQNLEFHQGFHRQSQLFRNLYHCRKNVKRELKQENYGGSRNITCEKLSMPVEKT